MIAYLRGVLLEKGTDAVVVDVHGVGYKVAVSRTSLADVPEVGQALSLRIHTHVREDALALYGFVSPEEEELFHHLCTVSGVGPKLALNILSGMAPAELAHALAHGEFARLTKLPGVGKKTAERLVVDLADKLKVSSILAARRPVRAVAAPSDDLTSALLNLGYRAADAERAAALAREQSPEGDLNELLRLSLKTLASKTG